MKTITYYAETSVAKAIEAEFGGYLHGLTQSELRAAIAYIAAPETNAIGAGNPRLMSLLQGASDNHRLALRPAFVAAL